MVIKVASVGEVNPVSLRITDWEAKDRIRGPRISVDLHVKPLSYTEGSYKAIQGFTLPLRRLDIKLRGLLDVTQVNRMVGFYFLAPEPVSEMAAVTTSTVFLSFRLSAGARANQTNFRERPWRAMATSSLATGILTNWILTRSRSTWAASLTVTIDKTFLA
ncbi:hypothetical protein M422DRAFT_257039 [Sphaerobolus stellatus SS14]|uniref:Uncharacterized protein n=1 Tax=Sphaerobolus stellatus (strain SS14) TaxID=990650 RepID=A0A0C9VFI2_SPHS4|nr:hypothetical protein M422DRAFT_257039 [Sphaerobolus stellatus SS14]